MCVRSAAIRLIDLRGELTPQLWPDCLHQQFTGAQRALPAPPAAASMGIRCCARVGYGALTDPDRGLQSKSKQVSTH